MYRSAFPDIHFHIGEMFAADGRAAHGWAFAGTHEGGITGVEPTGEWVEVSGVETTTSAPGIRTDNAPRVRFSAALSKEAGIEVTPG